jgi:tRNA(Arg) A34 adenosine deaminase TadA
MSDITITEYMDEAAQLAFKAMASGSGGPFGAVIVRNGAVIGRGMNQTFSNSDPTAHAEVQAIRDACGKEGTLELVGAVMYSSAEPCPMCMSAIYWSMLDAVYFGNTKHQSAECGFDDARIYEELRQDWQGRKMNMVHLPNTAAQQAFAEWERRKAEDELG